MQIQIRCNQPTLYVFAVEVILKEIIWVTTATIVVGNVVGKLTTVIEETVVIVVSYIVEGTRLVVVSVALANKFLPVSLCLVIEGECLAESFTLELVGKVVKSPSVMFVGKLREENKLERREYNDRNNN